jgi:hypothetical protein
VLIFSLFCLSIFSWRFISPSPRPNPRKLTDLRNIQESLNSSYTRACNLRPNSKALQVMTSRACRRSEASCFKIHNNVNKGRFKLALKHFHTLRRPISMKRILFPYPVFFLPYPADTADQKKKNYKTPTKVRGRIPSRTKSTVYQALKDWKSQVRSAAWAKMRKRGSPWPLSL